MSALEFNSIVFNSKMENLLIEFKNIQHINSEDMFIKYITQIDPFKLLELLKKISNLLNLKIDYDKNALFTLIADGCINLRSPENNYELHNILVGDDNNPYELKSKKNKPIQIRTQKQIENISYHEVENNSSKTKKIKTPKKNHTIDLQYLINELKSLKITDSKMMKIKNSSESPNILENTKINPTPYLWSAVANGKFIKNTTDKEMYKKISKLTRTIKQIITNQFYCNYKNNIMDHYIQCLKKFIDVFLNDPDSITNWNANDIINEYMQNIGELEENSDDSGEESE
jgi:hypothetical protein